MKNILFKLRILFLAPVIAFGADNQPPPIAEENIIIFLPDDTVKHIFSFLPITELQVFWINKQWYLWTQEADTFNVYANLCETYGKNKEICLKGMPSVKQAVDMVHELRTLFAALPASQDERAQLAENFENKYSLPIMLFRPSRGQGKVSATQAQKLNKALQEHFLILAMMRIHREPFLPENNIEFYSKETLDEECREQFAIGFSIHPLLEIIAPTRNLILDFPRTSGDKKIAHATALCDRGFYQPVLEEVHSSDDTLSNKELAQILFERGQNITSVDCIRLGARFSANNECTTACAWYKKALAQGLDDDDISERELARAGYAFFSLKDFASAVQCYEKALEKRPQGFKAGFFLTIGTTYAHMNNVAQAVHYFKIGIDMMIQGRNEHQGKLNYLLIKGLLIKDGAPQKYVNWVDAEINKSQQPASNEAQNNQ